MVTTPTSDYPSGGVGAQQQYQPQRGLPNGRLTLNSNTANGVHDRRDLPFTRLVGISNLN